MNAADAGDKIRIGNGVYKEAVKINGRKKRYLKLIGNPRKPAKVVLEGSGKKQNGDLRQRRRRGHGRRHQDAQLPRQRVLLHELNGYTMNHLIAAKTGVYGIYAFNTIGGRIINSEAYYVNDGALYIGQTPPQDNPIQTIVRNVDGWGSPIGFSATNMRYVTITKSRFYNNAIGIVPNALDSEKFPPPEDNVIIDNDIFWNNFNFHEGQPPFKVRTEGPAALVPIGTGILLLGGRGHRIENNRIYGNYLERRRRDRRDPAGKEPGGDLARPQHGPRQPVRARRDGSQRPRPCLRRQRQRQLLLAHRRRRDRAGRQVHVRQLHGHERRQHGRPQHDALVDRRGRPDRLGSSNRTRPRPGYKPLEIFNP